MQHVPRRLELPGAILGLCYHFIALFLPLRESRDGAGGTKPPTQGSPRDAARIAAIPGRNASPGSSHGAGELPWPSSSCHACLPPPASPLRCSCACLGNGKASALLNGLELPRQPPGLLPLPSAPVPPPPGKPHP